MNSKLFQSFTPALVGAVTVAAVGLPQAAQAGTVRAESALNFSNVTLELIDNDNSGDGIANLWNEGFIGVDASGDVRPPFGGNVQGLGPTRCPNSLSVPVANPLDTNAFGFASATGAIDCSTPQLTASNSALVEFTGDGPTEGTAVGEYTFFVADNETFSVTTGDTLDLDGFVNGFVDVAISGFDGTGTKAVEADFIGTYDVFLDDERVFSGPDIILEAGLANINDAIRLDIPNTDLDTLADGPVDYTFEDSGEARVVFFAREEAQATLSRANVPEPASILGLLAVGGAFGFLKRRQSH